MVQVMAATFKDGVFKPDERPALPDSVRVRAANGPLPQSDVGALEARPAGGAATVTAEDGGGRLVNGDLTVEITMPQSEGKPTPLVRFSRSSSG